MKTILGTVFVVVVLGLVGAHYYWRGGFSDQPNFRTLPVRRGDLSIFFTATGTVEPVEIVDVGARIVGSVTSFGPDLDKPGKTIDYRSHVKAGAVLAQLDDLALRAELDKARATLRLAQAELDHYRAREKQTERDFHRAEQLRDTESAAQFESARSDMEIAKADLAMSEAKVEQAMIAVKQVEINLGYTTIRSPVDGVVIDRRVNIGQTVVAGMNTPSLFLLAKDVNYMLVRAAVNEADIGDVRDGQKVTFKVDAYREQTFSGKVSQIRHNASLQQNVVMYDVVIDVDNTDGKLLPYMTAKLKFEKAHQLQVVLVPNQALRWQPTWEQVTPSARRKLTPPAAAENRPEERPDVPSPDTPPPVALGSPAVWTVADDGLVRPVLVKIGMSDGMMTEILGGELKPGDAVVTSVIREAMPDFVSSFISKVVDTKK